jgi:CheY-like chemotaxis protein
MKKKHVADKKLTVLLVEDNEVAQFAAKRLLTRLGYEVETAVTGEIALDLIQKNYVNYSFVLLDIGLPGIDGLKVAEEIRQEEKANGTYLPIIALTGHAGDAEEKKCYDAGIDDFMNKPANAEKLKQVLSKHGLI